MVNDRPVKFIEGFIADSPVLRLQLNEDILQLFIWIAKSRKRFFTGVICGGKPGLN
jgi:hypothetical protein